MLALEIQNSAWDDGARGVDAAFGYMGGGKPPPYLY